MMIDWEHMLLEREGVVDKRRNITADGNPPTLQAQLDGLNSPDSSVYVEMHP